MSKFINPFTDFGFKYTFGTEKSKPFLIDFLNGLLVGQPQYEPIVDVEYIDKEQNRVFSENRGIIYDILCKTKDGRHFIVEMQNSRQPYFINRSIFYMSRTIFGQGMSGEWNFQLSPVFIVSFMNFCLPELGDAVRTDAGLCNLNTNELLSDKIRFIYIQLPKFAETNPDNCKDIFSQWIYTLKNMKNMESMPFVNQRPVFNEFAKHVSYASLSPEDRRVYDRDLMAYRDLVNQMNYAKTEGREKGIKEGMAMEKKYSIRIMAELGINPKVIAEKYSMTVDEVMNVINN